MGFQNKEKRLMMINPRKMFKKKNERFGSLVFGHLVLVLVLALVHGENKSSKHGGG